MLHTSPPLFEKAFLLNLLRVTIDPRDHFLGLTASSSISPSSASSSGGLGEELAYPAQDQVPRDLRFTSCLSREESHKPIWTSPRYPDLQESWLLTSISTTELQGCIQCHNHTITHQQETLTHDTWRRQLISLHRMRLCHPVTQDVLPAALRITYSARKVRTQRRAPLKKIAQHQDIYDVLVSPTS